MDWNLKSLNQIDGDGRGNGSNTFGFLHSNFSVDLKLGQIITPIPIPIHPKIPSASSKRTRAAVAGGAQAACCLVDACTSDLSNCREYHRRHKVCEVHSKTPEVTIGGHKRRFCQQCSRFHSLGEFDEGKRSCRKRLDGHNRRRRKPQPESSSHRRVVAFFSNYPGERMFPFSTTDRAYTTASMNNPIWPELFRNDPFSASSSSTSIRSLREEGKQQFSNNNNVFSTNPSIIFNELPAKYGYDINGSSQILGSSSNRALSLLSSPSHHHHHEHQPDIVGLNPSSSLHQHYGGGLNNMSSSSSSSVMVQNGSVNSYQTMFQDQSSTHVPHTFPFYWRDA